MALTLLKTLFTKRNIHHCTLNIIYVWILSHVFFKSPERAWEDWTLSKLEPVLV